MTPLRTGRRAGFTLLEMLVVMAMLTVLLGLGVGVLFETRQAGWVGEATNHRAAWRTALADAFRTDVARAAAAPDRLGDLAAGPACLILQPKAGPPVVYRFADGALTRAEHPAGAGLKPLPLTTLPDKVGVEFVRPAGDRPLVTLRLTEPQQHRPSRVSDVSAALGGDLR